MASGNLIRSGNNSDSSVLGEEVFLVAHLHALETQYVEVNAYEQFPEDLFSWDKNLDFVK